MRSAQLTIEQARKLRAQVEAQLRYLNKLVDRMTKLGFAPGDDLHDAAIRAQAAVRELHVKAHYAGCKQAALANRTLSQEVAVEVRIIGLQAREARIAARRRKMKAKCTVPRQPIGKISGR